MKKYLEHSAHFEAAVASRVMTGVLLVFMLLQPLFGALSDRVGRRNCMIAFALWAVLTTISLMTAIGQAQTPLQAGLLILLALCGVSLYKAISGIVKAELFSLETRALGVGFCYAIGQCRLWRQRGVCRPEP